MREGAVGEEGKGGSSRGRGKVLGHQRCQEWVPGPESHMCRATRAHLEVLLEWSWCSCLTALPVASHQTYLCNVGLHK